MGYNTNKASYAWRVHHGQRWRKLSLLVRKQQPLCCNPYGMHGDTIAYSEQVHHIASIEQRPELAYSMGNLVAVCGCCHQHLSTLETRGVPTCAQVQHAFSLMYSNVNPSIQIANSEAEHTHGVSTLPSLRVLPVNANGVSNCKYHKKFIKFTPGRGYQNRKSPTPPT